MDKKDLILGKCQLLVHDNAIQLGTLFFLIYIVLFEHRWSFFCKQIAHLAYKIVILVVRRLCEKLCTSCYKHEFWHKPSSTISLSFQIGRHLKKNVSLPVKSKMADIILKLALYRRLVCEKVLLTCYYHNIWYKLLFCTTFGYMI